MLDGFGCAAADSLWYRAWRLGSWHSSDTTLAAARTWVHGTLGPVSGTRFRYTRTSPDGFEETSGGENSPVDAQPYSQPRKLRPLRIPKSRRLGCRVQ